MEFDTKIKVILRERLEPWQELNVTAFLISGIAGTQNIVGDAYVDADGVKYLPMSQQPIVILSAGSEKLSEVMQKATEKGNGKRQRKKAWRYPSTPKSSFPLTTMRTIGRRS